MPRPTAVLIAIITPMSFGCFDAQDAQQGPYAVVSDTIGDTIVVRTVSGSAWGDSIALIEEMAIGVLEGQDEFEFGSIQAMAVDSSGGVYIFDGQVPALRHFDAEGSYVRTLGGEGQGPGEYLDTSLGLEVRSDGRILMRDPRNGRINVYDPDGSFADQWFVASGLFAPNAMSIDQDDHVYLKILAGEIEPNEPWPIGLLHLDDRGEIVDTLLPPKFPNDPGDVGGIFLRSTEWAWSPLGYFVAGINDRYSFELRTRSDRILRIERETEIIALHPEEKAMHEARNEFMRRTQGQFLTSEIPPVPDTKPAYRELYAGDRGRIWVHLYVRAERRELAENPSNDPDQPPPRTWAEPQVFDIFEPDGTYLGRVTMPPRTTAMVFRGDSIWGTRRDELDVQQVVRFRIARN